MRGYTLIELLVVVAILGILAFVAIPSSGDTPAHRLDLVELQITDVLNRAAALARTSRETHAVVFDLSTDRIAILDKSGAPVIDPLTRRDFLVDFARPDQPKGIDLAGASFGLNGAAAIFDGQGLPTEGGTVTVSCRSENRTVTLEKATGKISSS